MELRTGIAALAALGLSACCFTPASELLDGGGADAGLDAGSDGGAGADAGPGCTIAGQHYARRALDPGNRGECCNPTANPTGWTPLFVQGASYPMGLGTAGNYVAQDLNGDHFLDLAICTGGAVSGVEVYLGLPDGGFADRIHSAANQNCSGMTSGAFRTYTTGAWIDLVLGYGTREQIAVLQNLGGGRFGNEVDFNTSGTVSCLAPATDLDFDGWPDVAYGQFDGTVGVLFGLGDGKLGNAISLATPGQPFSKVRNMATGDFAGHGFRELAVAGATSPDLGLAIFTGMRIGTFNPPIWNSAIVDPWQLAAAPFTGNYIDWDLAVSSGSQGNAYVTGSNLGGLGTATAYPSGVTGGVLVIADIDGDGSPDIVEGGGPDLVILFNRGDGTFWPKVSLPLWSGGVQGVILADLNSDGATDVAELPSNGSWTAFLNGCP